MNLRFSAGSNFFSIFLFLIILLMIIYTAVNQPLNEYNKGYGNYDGLFYKQITGQIKAGEQIKTEKPFAFRILVPAVAAVLPFDILTNYKTIAYLSFFAQLILLFVFFQNFVSVNYSLFGIILFILPFHSPLRWIFFYPVMVDYFFYVLFLLALIFLEKGKIVHLGITIFFMVLTREIGIIILLPAFIKFGKRSVALLLIGILPIMFLNFFITTTGEYNFIQAAVDSLKSFSFPQFFNSIFIAFGFMIFFAGRISKEYFLLFLIILILSILGGTNTVRFLYWSAPLVILSILRGIDFRYPVIFGLILIAQIINSNFFFFHSPDLINEIYRLEGGLQIFFPNMKLFSIYFGSTALFVLTKLYLKYQKITAKGR